MTIILDCMIEVFKTNVIDKELATQIVADIHNSFRHCVANFDLDDCDHVLRVQGIREDTDVYRIISLVKSHGYNANVLPDEFDPLDKETLVRNSEWLNI